MYISLSIWLKSNIHVHISFNLIKIKYTCTYLFLLLHISFKLSTNRWNWINEVYCESLLIFFYFNISYITLNYKLIFYRLIKFRLLHVSVKFYNFKCKNHNSSRRLRRALMFLELNCRKHAVREIVSKCLKKLAITMVAGLINETKLNIVSIRAL